MFLTLAILTAAFCIASVLPLCPLQAWWVRGWDFPRLQLAFLLSVLLVLQLVLLPVTALSTWVLVGFTVACLIYQFSWIYAYTPLHRKEVHTSKHSDPDQRIRILTANVLTPNRNAQGLLDIIRQYQPEVVVTLESDRWWQTQLSPLEKDYPYTIKCPLDNLYGMHVYSSLKLSEVKTDFLVEDDKPSMHALIHLRNGAKVRTHFLHPAPPSPTENDESSERDAELVMVGRSVAQSNEPIIVTGDLNDVAWSNTTRAFRKISGLLDPRVGRGMFNTFSAKHWFLRWPLDHLFHSHHFMVSRIERPSKFGSDHFPLFTELTYSPEPQESSVEADAEDQREAQEFMRQEDVKPEDVPKPGEH